MKTIFIFSLPRSGSTLLQRSLAAFPEIATTSEPWILLPGFFSLRRQGVYGIYGHRSLVTAHEDLCSQMPNGVDDYYDVLRIYMNEFYKKAAGGEFPFFLDKTPRYHLISNEIIKAMPDAKFIFLWRNPLAVAASIMNTWGGGRWNLYRYWIDFYAGMECMLDAYTNNSENVLSVQYENLLTSPEETISEILNYIGIDNPEALPEPVKSLYGRLGDPTGVNEFTGIDCTPLEKWKTAFSNPLRRAWGRRYIDWLGESRLNAMGYDIYELKSELASTSGVMTHLADDLIRMPIGELYNLLEPHILKDKLRSIVQRKRVYCLR